MRQYGQYSFREEIALQQWRQLKSIEGEGGKMREDGGRWGRSIENLSVNKVLGGRIVHEGVHGGRFDSVDPAQFHRFQLSLLDQFKDRQVVNLEGLSDLFGREKTL